MCQKVAQTLERDLTFCICLHFYFKDFFKLSILAERRTEIKKKTRDGSYVKAVLEVFRVLQKLLQRNLWVICLSVRPLWLLNSLPICLFGSFIFPLHRALQGRACNTSVPIVASFFTLSILSLSSPTVYLCPSACVGAYAGQTAHPLSALGGLPDRLLLSVLYCYCLLWRLKHKKRITGPGTVAAPCLRVQIHRQQRWWKWSQLLCLFCCVCVFVWKPSGYICQVVFAANSESYMHRSPHTHTHTQRISEELDNTLTCVFQTVYGMQIHTPCLGFGGVLRALTSPVVAFSLSIPAFCAFSTEWLQK